MPDYDVIVIGAGNGGLTSSALLAQAGKKVLLLERHNVPGGCATSFTRGRFEFEVALHQLSGYGQANDPGPLRHFLNKFGVTEKCEFLDMDTLYRLVLPGKLDITLPANREGTTKALIERFPQEEQGIRNFIDLMYRFVSEFSSVFYMRTAEPTPEKYPVLMKYNFKPALEVMEEYLKDPLLKIALGIYWGYTGTPLESMPFSDYAFMYFAYWQWKPSHIRHGSQAMSNAILDDFYKHGGTARFSCGAKRIIVENECITGVETEYGEIITAKAVVSNASTIDTYVEMIGEDNVPEETFKMLAGQTVGPSSLTLYIGLDCEPHEVGIDDATNFLIADLSADKQYNATKRLDTANDYLLVSCYNMVDEKASPAGTSQICVVDLKYAEPWIALSAEDYHKTKFEAADGLINRIEEVFPGFRSHIEEIEVATPLTHMRYLNTPGGAIYGFDQYAKNSNTFIPPATPIKGLAMVGAWSGMGGFQPSLMSGGPAAKSILRYLSQQEVK
jgi:prolycopene isomerase